jgi:hypothetical protein
MARFQISWWVHRPTLLLFLSVQSCYSLRAWFQAERSRPSFEVSNAKLRKLRGWGSLPFFQAGSSELAPQVRSCEFENIQCDARHHDDHDFRSSLPRPPPPSTAIGVRYLFRKLMGSIASLIWGYFSITCRLNTIFGAESIARLRQITIDITVIRKNTSSKLTFKYILLSYLIYS